MVHESLKKLLFEGLDKHPDLSKSKKAELKREINSLPDCVSFRVLRRTIEEFTKPLPLEGEGNDPNYHNMQICGNQGYCGTAKELGRCNGKQCFFSNNY